MYDIKRGIYMDKKSALRKSLINFISMTPMLLGIIGLVGIMQTYVTSEMLSSLFGYSISTDIVTGTVIGAVSSGNPSMSYIISDGLLKEGISLYAVTAFILAWVTLGIVQLPAEASVFGLKFTFYKNILTLLSTMMVAYLTILTLKVLS